MFPAMQQFTRLNAPLLPKLVIAQAHMSCCSLPNGYFAGRWGWCSCVPAGKSPDISTFSGGGIFAKYIDLQLTGGTIESNESDTDSGGGLGFQSCMVDLYGPTVSGNFAFKFGGGIYSNNATVKVFDATVSQNTARKNIINRPKIAYTRAILTH